MGFSKKSIIKQIISNEKNNMNYDDKEYDDKEYDDRDYDNNEELNPLEIAFLEGWEEAS